MNKLVIAIVIGLLHGKRGLAVISPIDILPLDLSRAADGVVVGSAIVRQVEANGNDPDLAAKIEAFVQPLADAVKSA